VSKAFLRVRFHLGSGIYLIWIECIEIWTCQELLASDRANIGIPKKCIEDELLIREDEVTEHYVERSTETSSGISPPSSFQFGVVGEVAL
jgi:hypothetical protein